MHKIEDLVNRVEDKVLLTRSLSEWHSLLIEECQVYSCGGSYIAKRFDEINYAFCEKTIAKEILIDNLYAILTYKYFATRSDEIDERIQKIVGSFTANLKRLLKSVTFDIAEATSAEKFLVQYLPDGCIAFANGVFDFNKNDWFFKYDITRIPAIHNSMYAYDNKYIIQWYLNYNFEPLPINITETSSQEFIDIFKEIDKSNRNYCFELVYNITHDSTHKFDINRFEHFCQILGYTCLNSFSQFFCLLIGSGQNGKNSLFDGCFTNRVVPRPASIGFDTIEEDRFITGSLENHSHNIFLETSAKMYTESKMIKALTGSMYQSIESKGISRYSGIINCKHIFAGNDRDLIKFKDTTVGFIRRINLFEIYYAWDAHKQFLKKGDYYDTSFSDALYELKSNPANTTVFVYLAMLGVYLATNQFNSYFKFTYNEWSTSYSDINDDFINALSRISIDSIFNFASKSPEKAEIVKQSIFTTSTARMYMSQEAKQCGFNSFDDILNDFNNEKEGLKTFFSENDVFASIRLLQLLINNFDKPNTFTTMLKKSFHIATFPYAYRNVPCVRMRCFGDILKIMKD